MDSEKIKQIAQTAGVTPAQVQRVLDEAVKAGLVRQRTVQEAPSATTPAKEFAAIKESILTKDIYAAAHRARDKSHQLLEDQGLASMAIAFSNLFASVIESPDEMLELAR
jgi:DNA-binding transcriptional regulator LsrR (DeoR family)